MDIMDPRTWDDETIDSLYQVALRTPAGTDPLARVAERILQEAAFRAELRLNRVAARTISQAEASEKHDASWYQSRQTEEQWLAEMEV